MQFGSVVGPAVGTLLGGLLMVRYGWRDVVVRPEFGKARNHGLGIQHALRQFAEERDVDVLVHRRMVGCDRAGRNAVNRSNFFRIGGITQVMSPRG